MKTLRSFADLEDYGIIMLTGESCRFSQRVLCDLTIEGQMLMQEFFGIELKSESWNRGVCSIMLTYDMFAPIARFALSHVDAALYIAVHPDNLQVSGFNDEAIIQDFTELGWQVWRNHPIPGQPVEGSRNVHAMSGRSA